MLDNRDFNRAVFRYSPKHKLYCPVWYFDKTGRLGKRPKGQLIKKLLSFGTFVILAFNAVIYYRQANIMKAQTTIMDAQQKLTTSRTLPLMSAQTQAAQDSANAALDNEGITRDALLLVQRAFIFPQAPETFVINSDPVNMNFLWVNSGSTPTKSMLSHISFTWMVTPLPDNFGFPDLWNDGAPHISTRTAVAARGVSGMNVTVPLTYITSVMNHQGHIYFWGWARYRDVFPKTPEHISKFCWELFSASAQKSGQTAPVTFLFSNCPRHNCFDETCQND